MSDLALSNFDCSEKNAMRRHDPGAPPASGATPPADIGARQSGYALPPCDHDAESAPAPEAVPFLRRVLKVFLPKTGGERICGYCGQPGADREAGPPQWPGQRRPRTGHVHASCEAQAQHDGMLAEMTGDRDDLKRYFD